MLPMGDAAADDGQGWPCCPKGMQASIWGVLIVPNCRHYAALCPMGG